MKGQYWVVNSPRLDWNDYHNIKIFQISARMSSYFPNIPLGLQAHLDFSGSSLLHCVGKSYKS